MTTLSVNWELAPEGTTHYMPENDDFYSSWLKKDAFGWQIWYHTGGQWYNGSWNLNKYLDTFLIKPVEEDRKVVWDGNGLPPVGVEVEWHECQQTGWQRVTVLAYHGDEAWIAPVGKPSIVVGNPANFRPIRTPEQIAEEEREKAIEEIMHVIPPGDINSVIMKGLYNVLKQAIAGLYDAGYRKEQK